MVESSGEVYLQVESAIAPSISPQPVVVNGKMEPCEDGRAIGKRCCKHFASVNTTECESERIPQVVATARIDEPITISSPPVQKVSGSKGFGGGRERAIAPNNLPQNQSKIDSKPPNNIPFSASVSPLPIVAKKLS